MAIWPVGVVSGPFEAVFALFFALLIECIPFCSKSVKSVRKVYQNSEIWGPHRLGRVVSGLSAGQTPFTPQGTNAGRCS